MRTRITEQAHVYKNNKCKVEFKKTDKKSISKTRQEFKDSANINKIINRFNRTGVLSSGDITNTRKPMYGDYEGIDYTETCRQIAKVEQDFMKQPPEIRAKYENDPQIWLKELEQEELTKLQNAAANMNEAETAANTAETQTEQLNEVETPNEEGTP
jgi:hypothetical protein